MLLWRGCTEFWLFLPEVSSFEEKRTLLQCLVSNYMWHAEDVAHGYVTEKRSKMFCKVHGKAPVPYSVFNKATVLYSATLLKQWLQHSCFPENFAKVFWKTFYRILSSDCFWTCPLQLSAIASYDVEAGTRCSL